MEQDFYESVGGNLYIGNLHPKVTEETLFREFCKFGPIESVKVMYPRNDEERTRGRNCGFVKFFEREDAELAMEELDGILIFGYEMKIGWGKAMPRHSKDITTGALTIQNVSPNIYEISRFLMSNPNFPVIRYEILLEYISFIKDLNFKSFYTHNPSPFTF
jgi:RNA recognition motif-containing protein